MELNLPQIRGKYRLNTRVRNWFDVGGIADVIFIPADAEDLSNFLIQRDHSSLKDSPLVVLGACSNVVIGDLGIRGVVVKLGAGFSEVKSEDGFIYAGAAALCRNVVDVAANSDLAGLEFMSGIPGAIGGAIAMNAGCYHKDISMVLVEAEGFDLHGNKVLLQNSDFGFKYRGSAIPGSYIFTKAKFKCEKSKKSEIVSNVSELIKKRSDAQPIVAKTGGSTFKNPQGPKKAWELIDEAGCRGLSIGGAKVSEKHCNFIVNTGSASALDIINLVKMVQKLVLEKTGVQLEMEIKVIGDI